MPTVECHVYVNEVQFESLKAFNYILELQGKKTPCVEEPFTYIRI